MSAISSNKTIAKNTALLYFRMIFTMAVGLFTSRVNLQALGVEDNGIYQVVGGVVTLFTFLSGSLSSATARFLTHEIGRGDLEKLRKTFGSLLNVHIFVAIIVLILCETIGLWFVEHKLVIPENRNTAAHIVFQLSTIAALLNITQIPYSSTIIAHERMDIFAYMSFADVTLKLLICYILYIINYDKLITYGVLILIVTTLIQLCYRLYCVKHFDECHFSKGIDTELIKPILSFSGWNLYNSFSSMTRDQGTNMIMNMFFGPVINSAIGFSNMIGTTIYGLANNFLTAIRQPIVKAYAINDLEKMYSLMINASKIAFVLMMILAAPFFFESRYILELWLKTPPAYTDVFCKIELLFNVILSMFLPLVFAIHASGNIKFVSIMNGTLWLLVLPISYFFLKYIENPLIPYIVKTVLLLGVIVSYYIAIKKVIPQFKIWEYTKRCVVPCIIVMVLFFSIFVPIHSFMGESSLLRLIETVIFTTLIILAASFAIIMDSRDKWYVLHLIKSKIG